jgi:hypothetical protein
MTSPTARRVLFLSALLAAALVSGSVGVVLGTLWPRDGFREWTEGYQEGYKAGAADVAVPPPGVP